MGDTTPDDFETLIGKLVNQSNEKSFEAKYRQWCEAHEKAAEIQFRSLQDGVLVDIELQPRRWVRHGLDLIQSRKSMGTVQLMGGIAGADLNAILPYPVFQIGAEVFLKGMWFFQHEELRKLKFDSYVEPEIRARYFKLLTLELGRDHDLIKIIGGVRKIDAYKDDGEVSRFLRVVEGLVRRYYHPLAQSRKPWADARYPWRFYVDSERKSAAEMIQSYPEHKPVARLFEDASKRVHRIWKDSEY